MMPTRINLGGDKVGVPVPRRDPAAAPSRGDGTYGVPTGTPTFPTGRLSIPILGVAVAVAFALPLDCALVYGGYELWSWLT